MRGRHEPSGLLEAADQHPAVSAECVAVLRVGADVPIYLLPQATPSNTLEVYLEALRKVRGLQAHTARAVTAARAADNATTVAKRDATEDFGRHCSWLFGVSLVAWLKRWIYPTRGALDARAGAALDRIRAAAVAGASAQARVEAPVAAQGHVDTVVEELEAPIRWLDRELTKLVAEARELQLSIRRRSARDMLPCRCPRRGRRIQPNSIEH